MKYLKSAILALSVAISVPALAQEKIEIKFSHVVAPDTPKGKAAEFFRKRAEELTNGQVKVVVYPNSQLYKDKEELEALQLGAVQMLAPTLSKFGPLGVKEFELFDLPFIFDGYQQVHMVTRGPVGKKLFDKLQTKGLTGLAYWDAGFKPLTSNRAIHTVSDVRGLKMRIASSKVLDSQMRALGALPQVMALSEVYQALQTGVVDGSENVPTNFQTQKMYEVQKYLTQTNHGYTGYAVVVNKRFWDGLPDGIRAKLTQAMDEATDFANEEAAKEERQALDAIRATGRTEIIALSPEERLGFKKALVKVHDDMTGRIGKDTIQAVYEATGFKPDMM